MLTTFARTRPVITSRAIAAAAARSLLHWPDRLLEREHGAMALEAADSLGNIGLKSIFSLCGGVDFDADPDDMIFAAISTESLPVVLENVANKSVVAAYEAVGAVANTVCAVSDLRSLRPEGRVRLTAGGTFERVTGVGLELNQPWLGDDSSHNITGSSYSRLYQIPREVIINDDAGAFLGMPKVVGRNAATTVERVLFELILANASSFFGTGNGNYKSGAGSALSATSLATAAQTLREQKDDNGDLLLQVPRFLMVPPALEATALAQYRLTNVEGAGSVNDGGSEMAGDLPLSRYTPITAGYLGAAGGLTGASDTGWYTFANPADIAAFEIGYLNGQRYPVIRTAPTDGSFLGVTFQAIFDFGVAAADPRAAVLSAGV
ncbi:MAG TPA: hypothetical protein VGI81_19830 [Tepidisphaeraceae bacterium]|jgi:hypothetical protein